MGGFFSLDGDGDTLLLADLTGVTDMWVELDVNGNMQLRETEADPHFPTQPQVEDGVTFGYALEFTGTLVAGAPSSTPTGLSVYAVPTDDVWQVSVGGVVRGSTNYIYEHGTNVLLYVLSSSSGQIPESVGLGGRYVYCRSQVGAAAMSSRFPAASGVLVAEMHPTTNIVVTYSQLAKNTVLGVKDPTLMTTRRDSQNLIETTLVGQPL